MKLASWNVNSIKVRLNNVERYLRDYAPDVLMMQELKGLDFPADAFLAMGYHTHAVVQKAYNGVAIASRTPITVIAQALDGDASDEQARYLEVEINGLRLINIYLPNGNPAPGDKFEYKLRWMTRLYDRLKTLRDADIPFIIGGDFNIIPEAKDAKNPKDWINDALFRPESIQKYRALINLGLYDALRCVNNADGLYTFWDYQAGAWQKDNGIRIDHFLLSAPYADRLLGCHINKDVRGWDTPSDHTPIEIILA